MCLMCVCLGVWLAVGGGVGGGVRGWGLRGACRIQDGAIQVALAVTRLGCVDSLLSGCFGRAGGQLRAASCQQSSVFTSDLTC